MTKKSVWCMFLMLFVIGLSACGSSSSSDNQPKSFATLNVNDIKAAALSYDDIDGSDGATNMIPAETIVVYKTKEGRYGKFLVAKYGYDLVINWVTYNADGSVYSEGDNLTVKGTWLVDLDNGVLTNVALEADFWWEQASDTERYIVPRNGAMFAVYP